MSFHSLYHSIIYINKPPVFRVLSLYLYLLISFTISPPDPVVPHDCCYAGLPTSQLLLSCSRRPETNRPLHISDERPPHVTQRAARHQLRHHLALWTLRSLAFNPSHLMWHAYNSFANSLPGLFIFPRLQLVKHCLGDPCHLVAR